MGLFFSFFNWRQPRVSTPFAELGALRRQKTPWRRTETAELCKVAGAVRRNSYCPLHFGETNPNSPIRPILAKRTQFFASKSISPCCCLAHTAAPYTLLSAVGRLSPQVLGLRVPVNDVNVHYQQVRDTWPASVHPTGMMPELQFRNRYHSWAHRRGPFFSSHAAARAFAANS